MICLVVLLVLQAVVSVESQKHGRSLGPTYTLQNVINIHPDNKADRNETDFARKGVFSNVTSYEWESYDGWYNNRAHPEWGGADMPLERRLPVAYPDGTYEIVPEQPRGNVLLISNATQYGLSGRMSSRRTALFTYFGQQVVEEMLDTQRPGCIPEYENIRIPKCHALYDPDCRSDRVIPFLRSRYDFRSGYSPNNPRMQLNEITPWMDGGLVYGPSKAWTNAIRRFKKGELASQGRNGDVTEAGQDSDIAELFPIRNDIGLPLANPPPPANHSLYPANRFWTFGNTRGNENPFLLSMGVLWFRVHQYWARQLYSAREQFSHDRGTDDEWFFNRARQFTIATYQHIVFDEWLPLFLPRKYEAVGVTNYPYNDTPVYSFLSPSTGYIPTINPQVPHIFQSAAMRWGHTVVTPGIWRRQLSDNHTSCLFGSPLSPDSSTNDFLRQINSTRQYRSWRDIIEQFYSNISNSTLDDYETEEDANINDVYDFLRLSVNESLINSAEYSADASPDHFAIRTCNSFWNPQVTLATTNVDAFYLGMASQAAEREDTIITPDLRGSVFGPLHFSRQDLMAINMQRARDHGLPDYNTARTAYGLPQISKFEEINQLYGIDDTVTENIENLRAVYNDDISRCDIWACGLAETVPSDGELGELSGPGELFTEVLFDHFMRVRHGDRFWYENSNNGLFSPEEVAAIKSLNLKDLIIQTTHIRDADISDNPFVFENAVCPQPFQLSELYMDDCTELKGFDYNDQSDNEKTLVWAFLFLYIFLVISVMLAMASYNKHVRNKILASRNRPPKEKKIEGSPVENDTDIMVFTELKAGLKSESRQVSLKFGPGKRIVLYFGGEEYRVIDLRFHTSLKIQTPVDNHYTISVKIPHEYDIILKAASSLDRDVFVDKLTSYVSDIGMTVEKEELPKCKYMLASAYTKKDRQATLEKFFRLLFHVGTTDDPSASSDIRKDILECELTKAEFAEAMSLKPDSLFVSQMFELIDKDKNGFVSFREFLDLFVIFVKGSPDDKIELMFHIYDINNSGMLERTNFRKMLKVMMEMVNTTINSDQMDQLIDSMFASRGFQNKMELSINDFKILLHDHKADLSSARLKIKGYDVPEAKQDTKRKDAKSEFPARYQAKENASAKIRRAVIKHSSGDEKNKHGSDSETVEQDCSSFHVEIPTIQRSATQTSLRRHYTAVVRYVENHGLQIFYFILFMFVCAGIFVERGYYYSVETEHAGIRRVTGFGLAISRGAASAMMFTYSILLLTMSRNLITFLRETVFHYYIPFDSYIDAHKVVALTALFFTFVHVIGHALNFYHISTQPPADLSCLFREVYYRTHDLPKFSYWLFLTMTGFAGFMATLVTVIIFVFATQYARRHNYRAFWVTHHWYIIFYILVFLHGSGRLVQDPLFGNFFLGPGIVHALDRLISVKQSTVELTVVRADILPSQVTGIYFKKPQAFHYRAGQWVKIASAAQNPGEFHSFTISSAPHEELLSLHIRAVGPWTCNFRENYNPANLQGKPYPKVFIDGPFGEGHQDWFRYEVAVLVGGGIGVTPFASILKELVYRFRIGARVECKKVFFIWVTRTQKQYEWFTEIIREAEEKDENNQLEAHIFITQFFDHFDLRTTMLYICEQHFQKFSGKSLFTGLRGITHFGRPDFNQFFYSLQEEYFFLPKIGVFSCGPSGMTSGVEAACSAINRFEGPAFLHHYENF